MGFLEVRRDDKAIFIDIWRGSAVSGESMQELAAMGDRGGLCGWAGGGTGSCAAH
jgi:hypothetical protein